MQKESTLFMGTLGKNPGVVCIFSSSGLCFVRTLPSDPSIFGSPARHGS